ncbi:D-alanine--D-alanine ligase [Paenibacillaceae bacterium]|nr:D-alanine--D-alanine ligase [Paenibacillaceae bacterium]
MNHTTTVQEQIIYIIYGGKSTEHDISLKTACTVLQALDTQQNEVRPIYITRDGIWCSFGRLLTNRIELHDLILAPAHQDTARSMGEVIANDFSLPGKKVAFPLMHGANGEDGTIQGLLELLNIPYVGNGVLSAAVTLDKVISKQLLAQAGVNQVAYHFFDNRQWAEAQSGLLQHIEEQLGYPCYVKPASLGSSIGISRCFDRQQLISGINDALSYDTKVLIEREIVGREIQVAVMGNERPVASLPGEFIHNHAFFDFDSKYLDKQLQMSIPAQIEEHTLDEIRKIAIHAYQSHCCTGLARVDFFLDEGGFLYLNEINALPGFTNFSMYPVMWERTADITYAELINRLIAFAFERHASKQTLNYSKGEAHV